jgi:hypothetical protein
MVEQMSNMEGVLGEIGRCNSKDIPTPNSSHSETDILKAITKLMTQLTKIQEVQLTDSIPKPYKRRSLRDTLENMGKITTMKTNKLMKRIHEACSTTEDKTKYYTNIDRVYQARRLTKHMVITTLDKAEATLTAM